MQKAYPDLSFWIKYIWTINGLKLSASKFVYSMSNQPVPCLHAKKRKKIRQLSSRIRKLTDYIFKQCDKLEVVSIEQRFRIWIFIRVKTHQNLFFCAFFYLRFRFVLLPSQISKLTFTKQETLAVISLFFCYFP